MEGSITPEMQHARMDTKVNVAQTRTEPQDLAGVLLALGAVRAGAGAEQPVARKIEELATPWVDEIRTDPLGSVWLICHGQGASAARHPVRIMLAAHMDEIGWLVRHIDERGFVRVAALGGPDVTTYLGHEVRLVTADGQERAGVFGVVPPHLTTESERSRFPEADDLFVDFGLTAQQARQWIRPGDILYPAVVPTRLGEHRLTSKALDNRASVATMLWALRLLSARVHEAEVVAVATVQEELGMVGARTSAFALQPDLAIALDVGFGDQPGVDRWVSLKLGKGPGLTVGPNIHPRLRQELKELAERIHVAVQDEVAPGPTGTDAWAIQVAGQGAPVALFSLPLRHMHSGAEVVDLRDLEESARLLAEFISSVDERWQRPPLPWPLAGDADRLGASAGSGGSVSTGGVSTSMGSRASTDAGSRAATDTGRSAVADAGRSAVTDAGSRASTGLEVTGRSTPTSAAGLLQDLAELSDLRGPSGHESAVRQWVQSRLGVSVDSAFVDHVGNLIVARGLDRPGPRILVDAHMDEVGLMVLGVDDDGLLRFRPLGGIDPRVLPAQRVYVGVSALPGVIGSKPIHLKKGEERRRAPEWAELYIDIGAADRETASRLVQPGDFVTFATEFGPLGEGYVKGKALDDRAGVALLLQLVQEEWPFPFFAAFTVQEEVGLRGAQVAVAEVEPEWTLVLEATTCADLPGVAAAREATRLGAGPVLTFRDGAAVVQPEAYEWAERVAQQTGVGFQWKRTTRGGNDAGAWQRRAGSRPVLSLSVPCRYLHSPVCVLATQDLEETLRLARALVQRASEAVGGRR